ncbi:MAG TPA: hypothetical protein VG838_08150 [Opitutaceae bacterium]|nr:hypothetical protein [Opitutaceae bacterium]
MQPLRLSLLVAILAGLLPAAGAQPALTIYNQDFAVVREHVMLDLKAGDNTVNCSGVTMRLEPDSVVLRDPTGKVPLRVLEQNYRSDTISQGLLLSLYEGKVLDFIVRDQTGRESTVHGKVIRSGYVPNSNGGAGPGQVYFQQPAMPPQGVGQPIIEVDGRVRFSLPGEPVFPALSDDAVLKPMLTWRFNIDQPVKVDAELSYITAGMRWEAAYNLVAPEKGDTLDVIGWVTIDNQTGKDFESATIKLMAGDVSKLQPEQQGVSDVFLYEAAAKAGGPAVTEKAFDEFHLYSLARPATLHDRETKQIEFIRATAVKARMFYVYNGAAISAQYRGWNPEAIRNNRDYGTQSNPKVWVMREFDNTEANGLGQPLPKGRTRFYRRDDADGRLEFTGENLIDHTPKNETVRIYTGDAFDLVGERKRTDYVLNSRNDSAEEAFEIHVRNRKSEAVEVRVAERLYRWTNWEIVQKSHDFIKTDAQNVEFRVNVPADGETVVTYRVRYNWQ